MKHIAINQTKSIQWLPALALCTFLIACGGGSSDAPTPDPGAGTDNLKFLATPESWVQLGRSYEYYPVLDGADTAPGYMLIQAPAGMTIDASSGRLFWTPMPGQGGEHAVTIQATVGSTSITQELLVTVSEKNTLVVQSVTPLGDSLSAAGISLAVPSAAISSTTEFTIEELSGVPDYEERTAIKALGSIYSITADDGAGNPVEEFSAPLTVTIDYDPTTIPADVDESEISAYLIDTDLQSVMVYAESTVDTLNNQVTFTTPHLTDYLLGYPSRLLYTAIVDDGRFFIHHRGPLDDMAAITAYSNKVLAAAQAAEALVTQRGFNKPSGTGNSSVIIRVHPEAEANGHYDPLSGIVYVDDTLDDTHIQTTTAHEYFHKVQDQYYAMSAANFTSLTWWYESTAPWYESLINPAITTEKINSSGNGYLRTSLFSKKRDDAYPKGTLVEYFESRVPDFVRQTFEDNSTTNSLITSIDKLINLDINYPHYVNWSLEKYGPGDGLSVVDGVLSIEESNLGVYFDQYDINGNFTPSGSILIDPDATTGILTHTIIDNSHQNTHRARIYSIVPSDINGASSKTLRISYTRQHQVSPNIPYVLTMNAAGQRVSLDALTPEDTEPYRVRRFGSGAQDQISQVYLILTEMDASAVDTYEWHIEVIEQPPLADIEIDLPADNFEASEIRFLQPEQFEFPTIAVDTSADSDAQGFSLSFNGILQGPPQSIVPGWIVTGIDLNDVPVTYADPDVGASNNNNFPGFPDLTLVTGLNNYDHFAINAFACDVASQECSSRGFTSIKYVDGAVDFNFTISPAQVVPSHVSDSFQVIPITPVTITFNVTNSSTLPVVINSLEIVLENIGLSGNELHQPSDTPLMVVAQGESRSFSFNDVEIALPSSSHGSTQHPRLLIGFGNCWSGDPVSGCGFNDVTLGPAALFWSGTFSTPTDLEVLSPP